MHVRCIGILGMNAHRTGREIARRVRIMADNDILNHYRIGIGGAVVGVGIEPDHAANNFAKSSVRPGNTPDVSSPSSGEAPLRSS